MMLYSPDNEQTVQHQRRNLDPFMASQFCKNSSDMNVPLNQEEFHLHAGCVSVLDILEAVGDKNFAQSWHERQRQQKMQGQRTEETDEGNDYATSDIQEEKRLKLQDRKASASSFSTTQSSDLESDEDSVVESTQAAEDVIHPLPFDGEQTTRKNQNNYGSETYISETRIPESRAMKSNQRRDDWLEKFSSAYPQLELDLDDLRDKFEGKEELLGSYLYSRVRHS
mmetsp:Transcript_16315/g.18476  ORF Transcript_16315/g.18476 Transcript_16315/m.18476 type:complete len:225 (+) Transcript_16315:873-1547(+)